MCQARLPCIAVTMKHCDRVGGTRCLLLKAVHSQEPTLHHRRDGQRMGQPAGTCNTKATVSGIQHTGPSRAQQLLPLPLWPAFHSPVPGLLLKHVDAHCCYDLDGHENQGAHPVGHGGCCSAAAGSSCSTGDDQKASWFLDQPRQKQMETMRRAQDAKHSSTAKVISGKLFFCLLTTRLREESL